MRFPTASALILTLALASCGEGSAPENRGEAAPDAIGTEAEVAQDAALADEAAQAEAEDAAIGGNVTAEDVSAAGNMVSNAQ